MLISFKDFFESLGIRILAELKSNIEGQKSLSGGAFSPLEKKTVDAKIREGYGSVAEKRMVKTRDFMRHAFGVDAKDNSVKIGISTGKHGRALKSMKRTLEKYRETGSKKFAKQSVKVATESASEPTYEELTDYQNLEDRGIFFPTEAEHIMELKSVRQAPEKFKRVADNFARQIIRQETGLSVNG